MCGIKRDVQSELLLVAADRRSFTPNWIVRTLNVRQDDLLRKYGIRYGSRRTKDGKVILLRWEGVR